MHPSIHNLSMNFIHLIACISSNCVHNHTPTHTHTHATYSTHCTLHCKWTNGQKLERVPNRFFSFLNPLAVEIWLSIIVAYVLVSFTIWIVARFSPLEWQLANTTACLSVSTSHDHHTHGGVSDYSHDFHDDNPMDASPHKYYGRTGHRMNAKYLHDVDRHHTSGDDNSQIPLLAERPHRTDHDCSHHSFDTMYNSHRSKQQRLDGGHQHHHHVHDDGHGHSHSHNHQHHAHQLEQPHQHHHHHHSSHNQSLHAVDNDQSMRSDDSDVEHDCDDGCGENELLCSENDFTLKNSFWYPVSTLIQNSDLNPKVYFAFSDNYSFHCVRVCASVHMQCNFFCSFFFLFVFLFLSVRIWLRKEVIID